MRCEDIAVAAALVDAGLVKVASDEEFEGFVKEASAVPGDDRLVAALGAAIEKTAGDERQKLVDLLLQVASKPPVIAGTAGAALGLYLGNESKRTRDQLGLPYNYEYEF